MGIQEFDGKQIIVHCCSCWRKAIKRAIQARRQSALTTVVAKKVANEYLAKPLGTAVTIRKHFSSLQTKTTKLD